MSIASSWLRGLLAVAVVGLIHASAFAQAPANGANTTNKAQPSAAPAATNRETVIHVHHHYYFPFVGDPTGDDPAARYSPYEFSGRRMADDVIPAFNNDWGNLGLFGYLGKQGDAMGMIVSRVKADSPAAKLGLVTGDVITKINDLDIGDMSFRELETLFTRLSTTPKINVTMQVWNYHTRRGQALKGVLENDPPDNDE